VRRVDGCGSNWVTHMAGNEVMKGGSRARKVKVGGERCGGGGAESRAWLDFEWI